MFFIYGLFFTNSAISQIICKYDTIEHRVNNVLFITNDSAYNCFMSINPTGKYIFFSNKNSLEQYIEEQTSGELIYWNDSVYGNGSYIQVFKNIEIADTIYNYFDSEINYFVNGSLKTDSFGIPILEYDLENSYILQKMNQIPTNKYIYTLINYGTQIFFLPFNKSRKSTLIKVDVSQDSVFNFFVYYGVSNKYSGMELTHSDSSIVPLKKMKRIINDMDLLSKNKESKIFFNNGDKNTRIIIIKNKRFLMSCDCAYIQCEKWIELTRNLSMEFERLKNKHFAKLISRSQRKEG